MKREEAKEIFLNRGFINGIFDSDKLRQSFDVISDWLEDVPMFIIQSDGTIDQIINCNDCIYKESLDQIKSYIEHIKNTGLGKKKSLEFIEKYIEGLRTESEVENERNKRKPH